MGSESSRIQTHTATTTNATTYITTNSTTTNNSTTNYINITIPQISDHQEQNALEYDVSGRPALTHSFPESQGNNNTHESEYMISANLHNERESSIINKKKYLQSAILNCSHTQVRSNDVRQTFEQNKWEFKKDDFNEICINLLTIGNLEQRLNAIETVRICLEENINYKLENNHSDVNIFVHFSEVIEDIFKATKEAIDKQKSNEKQYYYTEEEEQQFYEVCQSQQLSSTTSNATEIVPHYNVGEQIALFNSLKKSTHLAKLFDFF